MSRLALSTLFFAVACSDMAGDQWCTTISECDATDCAWDAAQSISSCQTTADSTQDYEICVSLIEYTEKFCELENQYWLDSCKLEADFARTVSADVDCRKEYGSWIRCESSAASCEQLYHPDCDALAEEWANCLPDGL